MRRQGYMIIGFSLPLKAYGNLWPYLWKEACPYLREIVPILERYRELISG